MDSGNSSSMQSSSGGGGGEEEYDSRAHHSISAFFNHHNSATSTTPPPIFHLPDPPPPHHLDPLLDNYFTNLDPVWPSKILRPAPPDSQPVFFTNPTSLPDPVPNTSDSVPRGGDNNNNKNGNNSNNNNNTVRNPKKRSRASRRAPTTVLTTDTSNFRAMVQEFTGIPAPPFAGSSSPFSRTGRFDLFGSSPNSSFPLKPFAHKLIPPSFLSSSSSSSSSSPSSSTAAVIASSSSPSLSSYYLPSSAEHQNLLNTNTQSIPNPFFSIHAPKDPLTHHSIFAAKSKPLFDQSHHNIKVGNNNSLDEFGHFGGLQSIVSSSSTSALMHINKNPDAQNDLLRSINGGYGEPVHRAPSYRATAAAAAGTSSAPENNIAAARNEGMVESWICSSD